MEKTNAVTSISHVLTYAKQRPRYVTVIQPGLLFLINFKPVHITIVQSGASGHEKGFVNCFLRAPQAIGLYRSRCAAKQGRGAFWKQFTKYFSQPGAPYCTHAAHNITWLSLSVYVAGASRWSTYMINMYAEAMIVPILNMPSRPVSFSPLKLQCGPVKWFTNEANLISHNRHSFRSVSKLIFA